MRKEYTICKFWGNFWIFCFSFESQLSYRLFCVLWGRNNAGVRWAFSCRHWLNGRQIDNKCYWKLASESTSRRTNCYLCHPTFIGFQKPDRWKMTIGKFEVNIWEQSWLYSSWLAEKLRKDIENSYPKTSKLSYVPEDRYPETGIKSKNLI